MSASEEDIIRDINLIMKNKSNYSNISSIVENNYGWDKIFYSNIDVYNKLIK